MKINLVKQIDVEEWDNFIQKTYNKPYSFQQQDGCKNRGIEYISTDEKYLDGVDFENVEIPFIINGNIKGVSFETWLNTSPEDTLKHFKEPYNSDWENELFWHRNFYPHVLMIVNDLCKKGLFELGEYQIKIDW